MEDTQQAQSNTLVRETRATIKMLQEITARLEHYTDLLEAEVARREPEDGEDVQ